MALVVGLCLFVCPLFGEAADRLAAHLALLILCVASVVLCRKHDDIRVALRWALWSKDYKASVLAQPSHKSWELKHLEWDSWGLMTSGTTTVYVVFDPDNSLAEVADADDYRIVLTPLPCSVSKIRRLEKSWYSVICNTGTTWDNN